VLFHELHKVASATVINMWKHGLQPKASGCVRLQASIEGYAYWCDALLWDWKTEMCTKTADAGFASSMHRDVVPPPHQLNSSAGVLIHGLGVHALAARHRSTFGPEQCVSVAIVREPLSRLISAYMYCKVSRLDPLCANHMLYPRSGGGADRLFKRVPLAKFAAHWGNYMLRELLMAEWPQAGAKCGILCQAKAASPTLARRAQSAPIKIPWFLHKLALNGSDDARTSAGRAAVRRVTARLRGFEGGFGTYDALGIMERWSDSMANFDEAVPLARGERWAQATARLREKGIRKSGEVKATEAKYLKEAHCSMEILGHLAGDLYLYHRVLLPLFEEQRGAGGGSRIDGACAS